MTACQHFTHVNTFGPGTCDRPAAYRVVSFTAENHAVEMVDVCAEHRPSCETILWDESDVVDVLTTRLVVDQLAAVLNQETTEGRIPDVQGTVG